MGCIKRTYNDSVLMHANCNCAHVHMQDTCVMSILTNRNLQDFGIGKNSLAEGGVGLFVMFGAGAAVALVCWAKGIAMRSTTPYQVRSA